MKVVPHFPFRHWAPKAEAGEMPAARAYADLMTEVMRPQFTEIERIALDALAYGRGMYRTHPDGRIERIPPEE